MGLVCCSRAIDDVEEVRFGGKSMWQMLRAGMEMADLIIFANAPENKKIQYNLYKNPVYIIMTTHELVHGPSTACMLYSIIIRTS